MGESESEKEKGERAHRGAESIVATGWRPWQRPSRRARAVGSLQNENIFPEGFSQPFPRRCVQHG